MFDHACNGVFILTIKMFLIRFCLAHLLHVINWLNSATFFFHVNQNTRGGNYPKYIRGSILVQWGFIQIHLKTRLVLKDGPLTFQLATMLFGLHFSVYSLPLNEDNKTWCIFNWVELTFSIHDLWKFEYCENRMRRHVFPLSYSLCQAILEEQIASEASS